MMVSNVNYPKMALFQVSEVMYFAQMIGPLSSIFSGSLGERHHAFQLQKTAEVLSKRHKAFLMQLFRTGQWLRIMLGQAVVLYTWVVAISPKDPLKKTNPRAYAGYGHMFAMSSQSSANLAALASSQVGCLGGDLLSWYVNLAKKNDVWVSINGYPHSWMVYNIENPI